MDQSTDEKHTGLPFFIKNLQIKFQSLTKQSAQLAMSDSHEKGNISQKIFDTDSQMSMSTSTYDQGIAYFIFQTVLNNLINVVRNIISSPLIRKLKRGKQKKKNTGKFILY